MKLRKELKKKNWTKAEKGWRELQLRIIRLFEKEKIHPIIGLAILKDLIKDWEKELTENETKEAIK